MQAQPQLDQSNLPKIRPSSPTYLTRRPALGKGLATGAAEKAGKDSERYVGAHADTLNTLKATMDKSITQGAGLARGPLQFSWTCRVSAVRSRAPAFVASSSIGSCREGSADAKAGPNCQKLAAK